MPLGALRNLALTALLAVVVPAHAKPPGPDWLYGMLLAVADNPKALR